MKKYLYEPDMIQDGNAWIAVLKKDGKIICEKQVDERIFSDEYDETARREVLESIASALMGMAQSMEAEPDGKIIN